MIDEYQIFLNKMDLEAGAWYFFEKHFQSEISTNNKFIPYPYQQELLLNYKNNNHVIVSFPRQKGLTTTTACYLLWKAAFFRIDAGIILNNFSQCRDMANFLSNSYFNNLPSTIRHCSPNGIRLSNNSQIYLIHNINQLRGFYCDIMWIDNYNYFSKNAESELIAIFPYSLRNSLHSQMIITGSNNHYNNSFADIWSVNNKYMKITMNAHDQLNYNSS